MGDKKDTGEIIGSIVGNIIGGALYGTVWAGKKIYDKATEKKKFYCPECGNVFVEGTKFCPQCGSRL